MSAIYGKFVGALVGILLLVGLWVWGYNHGVSTQAGREAAAREAAVLSAVEEANKQADLERNTAIQTAKEQQAMLFQATEKRLKVALYAAKNNRPECARPIESHRLLTDAISEANRHPEIPASGVLSGMPEDTVTGGSVRGGDVSVGNRTD